MAWAHTAVAFVGVASGGLASPRHDGRIEALPGAGTNTMPNAMNSRKRGVVKFVFWTVVASAVITFTVRSYTSGQMAEWFYHRAAVSGYAVNVDQFSPHASQSRPVVLQVVTGEEISGLVAIHVAKGDRLPRNTNGVIADETVKKARRASLSGSTLQVAIPWEIKEAKGFKFKDTFKHKGVETWPWSGVWNGRAGQASLPA